MRLPLEEGLRPLQKVALRVVKAMTGRASGPVLVASYNKAFFGNGWAPCMKRGMRGATEEEAQKIGSITFRLGYGIAKLPG